MVKYLDTPEYYGYYYVTDEGSTFGDGTEEMDLLIKKTGGVL